jgi:hypothetical protein
MIRGNVEAEQIHIQVSSAACHGWPAEAEKETRAEGRVLQYGTGGDPCRSIHPWPSFSNWRPPSDEDGDMTVLKLPAQTCPATEPLANWRCYLVSHQIQGLESCASSRWGRWSLLSTPNQQIARGHDGCSRLQGCPAGTPSNRPGPTGSNCPIADRRILRPTKVPSPDGGTIYGRGREKIGPASRPGCCLQGSLNSLCFCVIA